MRQEILAEAVGSNTTAAKAHERTCCCPYVLLRQIGKYMSDALGGEISNLTTSALGDKIGQRLSI